VRRQTWNCFQEQMRQFCRPQDEEGEGFWNWSPYSLGVTGDRTVERCDLTSALFVVVRRGVRGGVHTRALSNGALVMNLSRAHGARSEHPEKVLGRSWRGGRPRG